MRACKSDTPRGHTIGPNTQTFKHHILTPNRKLKSINAVAHQDDALLAETVKTSSDHWLAQNVQAYTAFELFH